MEGGGWGGGRESERGRYIIASNVDLLNSLSEFISDISFYKRVAGF